MKMLQQRSCEKPWNDSRHPIPIGKLALGTQRRFFFGHRGEPVVIHTVRYWPRVTRGKPANRGGRVNQSVDRHVTRRHWGHLSHTYIAKGRKESLYGDDTKLLHPPLDLKKASLSRFFSSQQRQFFFGRERRRWEGFFNRFWLMKPIDIYIEKPGVDLLAAM